ncbi:MAG: LysM peptidoglycan-binding domain-containing protein [Thermogutta sp.]
MDRGLWVFLIVAAMSWLTVWAVLMHPRGVRDEPNPFATSHSPFDLPSSGPLLSIQSASQSEDEVLTTRGMLPATDELRREIQLIGGRLGDNNTVPQLIPVFPGRTERSSDGRLAGWPAQGEKPLGPAHGRAEITGRGLTGEATRQNPSAAVRDVADRPPSGRTPAAHRVQDGDTLPSLAERYLGDGSLWPILYEMNRDRIPSPDLLPLGVSLIVDPARAADAKQMEPPSPSGSPLDGEDLPPLESVEIGRFTNPAASFRKP